MYWNLYRNFLWQLRAPKHCKTPGIWRPELPKPFVLQCFGMRKPAPECSLVAQRHVFYGFNEAILDFRDEVGKPLYFMLKIRVLWVEEKVSCLSFASKKRPMCPRKSSLWPVRTICASHAGPLKDRKNHVFIDGRAWPRKARKIREKIWWF